ncbi:MAG: hypothetical protein Q8N84_04265, partial [bacterium]|nr:hypothetical protein [bacterium]
MFLAHKPRSEKQSGSLSYGLVVAFFALVGLMIVATPFLPYLSDYASPSIAWQVLESLAAIQKSLQSGQEKAVGFVSPTKFDQAAVLAAESDQSLYIVLDSNWNISIKGDLTADQIVSTSPVSSPLIVSSNKEVANLNANYLQGKTANDFLSKDAFSTVTLQPTDQIFLGTSSLYYLKGDGSGHFKDLIVLGSVSLPNDSVVDAYIPNTITASNYLPLAGGTMTGGITFVSGQDFALGDSGSSINFDEVASSGTLPDLYLETISRAGKVSDTALSTNIAKLDTAQTFSANKTFSAKAYFGGTTYYLDSSGNAYLLDVHLGAIGLTDTASATTSGAYVIGTYDEFSNSASANVQDVLDDLDAAITTGGGSSMWSLSSGTVYPTLATTDFVVGADTLTAPFSVDESSNTVRIGEGSNSDAILNMYSASGATGSVIYSQNDAWGFTGGNIGIGTTAPTSSLSVGSSSQFQVTAAGLDLAPSGTVIAPSYSIVSDTNTGLSNVLVDTLDLSTGGSSRLRIDSGGNVGIGMTNPTYKLDINGDTRIASGSDLHLGTTGLTDVASATSSGAYLIGTFGEFGNSSSANVQDVLDDLDSAIASGGVGSMWTLSSSVISPSSVTNDLAVGSATLVAPFSVDESANTVRIGEGSGSNAVIKMYSSNNDTGSITYTGDDRFVFSNGSVEFGSSYFTGNLDMGNQSILNATALNSKASQSLLMIGWGDSAEAFRV